MLCKRNDAPVIRQTMENKRIVVGRGEMGPAQARFCREPNVVAGRSLAHAREHVVRMVLGRTDQILGRQRRETAPGWGR